jgi:hypothetical protein
MTDNIPQKELNNLFAIYNQLTKPPNTNNSNSNNNNQNRPINYGRTVVFGNANLRVFGEIPGMERLGGTLERDPVARIRLLTNDITGLFYGEPRMVDDVVGAYMNFIKARIATGKPGGARGLNAKGLIVSLLFIIVYKQTKTKLDLEKLIKAANGVKGESTVKVTKRMIQKYIKLIIETLKELKNTTSNNLSNSNTNNMKKLIDNVKNEVKRIGFKLGYNFKENKQVQDKVDIFYKTNLGKRIFIEHVPHTIAAMIVFIHEYEKQSKNNITFQYVNSLRSQIGISVTAFESILKKVRPNIPHKKKQFKKVVVNNKKNISIIYK